jgi:hypothetical protein
MNRFARAALALAACLALLPGRVSADGGWLDGPHTVWNTPGMSFPAAQAASVPIDPRCGTLERPAELYEDSVATAAGWRLVGGYLGGWGIVVLEGTAGYDGMCRPIDYQVFVFADGLFAGTISPVLMASRTDGAGYVERVGAPNQVFATFARYQPSDPLCCPSSTTPLGYEVRRTAAGPALVPEGW